MKTKIFTATLFIILFIISSSSFAFDGIKKGFTLGFSAGVVSNYHWHNLNDNSRGTTGGLGLKFDLGYNWNNRDLIAFKIGTMGNLSEESRGEGQFGLEWHHDFRKNKKSLYSIASVFMKTGGIEHDGFLGGGYSLGLGYELSDEISISAEYYRSGSTKLNFFKPSESFIINSLVVSFNAFLF